MRNRAGWPREVGPFMRSQNVLSPNGLPRKLDRLCVANRPTIPKLDRLCVDNCCAGLLIPSGSEAYLSESSAQPPLPDSPSFG